MEAKSIIVGVIVGLAPCVIWWLMKPPEGEMGVLWVGIRQYWMFTQQRKLANLERYRALLERLNQRDHDYNRLVLGLVLLTLMFLAAGGIVFPGLERISFVGVGPVWRFLGLIAGIYALVSAAIGVQLYFRVQQYGATLSRLDQQIATLRDQLPDSRSAGSSSPGARRDR